MRSSLSRKGRFSAFERAIALLLTWAIPGSSAWAMAPVEVPAQAAALAVATARSIDEPTLEAPVEPAPPSPLAAPDSETASSSRLEDDDDDEAVRPILECVVRHSSNSYTAYFGFRNENDQAISIPVGSRNAFSPSPQNRSQPTTFPKGRSPYYPDAAFSVPFNGSNLTWSLRGPDQDTRSVTANSSSPRCHTAPSPTPTATPTPTPAPTPAPLSCAATVVGPMRFTRDCNDHGPTEIHRTFSIPSGSTGPYTLRVVNGDPQGRNKTTSAEVKINGVEVIGESDFSNTVVSFTKVVPTLQPVNQLYVRVKGAPNSTFTIEICQAGSTDTTPPVVQWLTPVADGITRETTPPFHVSYTDAIALPNLSTLSITLDGVDRTAAFTKTATAATYEGPPALVDGTHVLRAEIKDQAGNLGSSSRSFRVDSTPPLLSIQTPAAGFVTNQPRPTVLVTFGDEGVEPSGVAAESFRLSIDDQDVTSAFVISGTQAEGQPPAPLTTGAHTITAVVSDAAGNLATTSRQFIVDTVLPSIVAVAPAANQLVGAGSLIVGVEYADNDVLEVSSFTAHLDDSPVAMFVDVDRASATLANPGAGPHTLVFTIRDRAGNTGSLTVPFSVDTAGPDILIVSPLNGVPTNRANPEVTATFSDPQGIDISSVRVVIDDVDRTADFTVSSTEATGVSSAALAEGPHTLLVRARDTLGNEGTATSTFVVDVTAPVVSAASSAGPLGYVKDANQLQLSWADSRSGIEIGATVIRIDDVNVTDDFAIGPVGAIAKETAASLTEGRHVLSALVVDRAGNSAAFTLPFHVDRTSPAIDFVKPGMGGFANSSTPEVWLRIVDAALPDGSPAGGVAMTSLRVHLIGGGPSGEDLDLTPLFAGDPLNVRGTIVPALADGFHTLRFRVLDAALNESVATGTFLIDTVAPLLAIDTPGPGAAIGTSEVAIELAYSDQGSGLDSELTQLYVDGAEREPDAVVLSAIGARLSLTLPDGPHRFEVRVVDRAGNATDLAPVDIHIDTVSPTAVVVSPSQGAYFGASVPPILFSLRDAALSSGINGSHVELFLDGAALTEGLVVTPSGGGLEPVTAEVSAPAPGGLGDGTHTLRLKANDKANNPVELIVQFTVDTTPPVVTPEIPEGGITIDGGGVNPDGTFTFTGTLSDANPALSVSCSASGATVAGTITGNTYSCRMALSEGENEVTVTVTDSTGNTTTSTSTVTLDTQAPVVFIDMPGAAEATNAPYLSVVGHVVDATPVAVTVNGVAANVNAGAPGQPASFAIGNVPAGGGETLTLTVVATDAAGNVGQATRVVIIDRIAPVVTILRPAANAYLKPGVVDVEVEVSDRDRTALDVNGIPGVDPACVPDASGVRCRFLLQVPLAGEGSIVATAIDAAQNVGHATITAVLDSAPPSIVVTGPAPLSVTNASDLRVTGRVTDASPLTFTVNGQTIAVGEDGSFDAQIPAGIEGVREIVFTATDAAGNQSTETLSIVIDRTAPVLTIASPLQGAVIPASPVVVTGTVTDATSVDVTVLGTAALRVGQAYTFSIQSPTDGPLAIVVRAVDAAGNETTLIRAVEIDFNPPTVTITSPASGTLTQASSAVVSYVVADRSVTQIRINGQAVSPDCPGQIPCERTYAAVLQEGDNTITVEATDAGGRSASAEVMVTRDSTPPTVTIDSPDTVTRDIAVAASAAAADLQLATLELKIGTTVICTGTPTCSGTIPIPADAQSGATLVLTAVATDRAGNSATASRAVRVTSSGIVTGTVLHDLTSLPLAGATVTLLAAQPRSVLTDASGRYAIPVSSTVALLRIERPLMTSVDRTVSMVSGTGTIPVDARLTPLAATTTAGVVVPAKDPPATIPAQAQASAGVPGPVRVTLPPGSHQVTLLSSQGLPNLLPGGFSPLAAFDWQGEGGVAQASFAAATDLNGLDLVLVRYDAGAREWRAAATGLVVSEGVVTADVASPGSYALVVADSNEPPLQIPVPGSALVGTGTLTIPEDATSASLVSPAVLPPTGGTATGSLRLDTSTYLPSGTVVQGEIDESYTLFAGDLAGAPKRPIDIVAYRRGALSTAWTSLSLADGFTGASVPTACAPATPGAMSQHLCAAFPITPSRSFSNAGLREGRVHLDILAGREHARGSIGGSAAVGTASGNVTLSVVAGSLPEDTVVSVADHAPFSPFVPSTPALSPLAEVTVDFATAVLNSSAALSFSNLAALPGDTLVLARVEHAAFDGIPRFEAVAFADVTTIEGATRVITRPDGGQAGLEGVRRSGRYVLFKLAGSVGVVRGATTAGGSPVRALVSATAAAPAATLPFVSTASASGAFALVVSAGTSTLNARVLGLSLAATAAATVSAGGVVVKDIALEGTVTLATTVPAPGAVGVEVNEPITLTSPIALDPATVNAQNIVLRKAGTIADVPLRFVLSGSTRLVSIIPVAPVVVPPAKPLPALEFDTEYVLTIGGLLDSGSGVVTVPTLTFRTNKLVKRAINTAAIQFSFPDALGVVTITAPAGSFDPGTTVLIVNAGNGVVVSLTAGNDGEIQGALPAGLDDLLFVTITDPFGDVTTFERNQFVDPATGEASVGAFGGVVQGPLGSAVEVPANALGKGTKFKLDFLTPEAYEQTYPGQIPDFGEENGEALATFGGALKVEMNGDLESSKEMDLVFPVPANLPEGADPSTVSYYVIQRIEGPCPNAAATCAPGEREFFVRTLDEAFLECPANKPVCPTAEKKVRTASAPFAGFMGGFGFGGGSAFLIASVATSVNLLMWEINQLDPGAPMAGAVTGYVYQPRRVRNADGVDTIEYLPVRGARVSVQPIGGGAPFRSSQPDQAVTNAAGQYTFFYPRYVGGAITVTARIEEEGQAPRVATATGFESDPQDAQSIELVPYRLRRYTNRAIVNLNFEVTDPPAPQPDIRIELCEATPLACEARGDGLVLVGRSLRITVDAMNTAPANIEAAEINGAAVTVRQSTETFPDRRRFELVTGDALFTPDAPGAYVVRVRAFLENTLDTRFETLTFRAVGSTGSTAPLPTQAPAVISQRTLPRNGDLNISVANLRPEIYFTEPVRGITAGGTVQLEETADGATTMVPFTMVGIGVGASGAPTIVQSVNADTLVTSLTLKPTLGLKLDASYRLIVTDGVVDTDAPPRALAPAPYESRFTTFRPSVQGTSGAGFGSTGIGLVGERAYVVRNFFYRGAVSVWDVADPELPLPLTPNSAELVLSPRPADLSTDPSGDQIAAVSLISTNQSRPSTVVFVDGENPAAPRMAGAVTVTSSAADGFIARTVFHKGFVYLATTRKGIQIVDAAAGLNILTLRDEFDARQAMNLSGGWGQSALRATIPLPPRDQEASRPPVHLGDIAAADIQDQPLVAATGAYPLVIADPLTLSITKVWKTPGSRVDDPGTVMRLPPDIPGGAEMPIVYGHVVALGKVGAYDLAVVVVSVEGVPAPNSVRLVTVDVRNSSAPLILGSLDLRPLGGPSDIVLRGTTAIVTTQDGLSGGEAIIVELVDPATPYIKGRIRGAGGRAAINSEGLVVTTATNSWGFTPEPFAMGGIQVLGLESACLGLGSVETKRVIQYRLFDRVSSQTRAEKTRLRFNLCQSAQVTLSTGDGPVESFTVLNAGVDGLDPAPISDLDLGEGKHSVQLPEDLLDSTTDSTRFRLHIRTLVDQEERNIDGEIVADQRNRPMRRVSRTLVKGVDLFSGHLSMGATDLVLKGRHIGMDVTRGYSSGGSGAGTSGWTWNYESVVSRGQDPTVYNVVLMDGTSHTFTTTDQGETFVPEPGYHTRLETRGEGRLALTDLAGNVHMFKAFYSDVWISGPWLLESVREPHGDEIRIERDRYGRVAWAREYHHNSESAKASLQFVYEPFQPVADPADLDPLKDERLQRVIAERPNQALNLLVTYGYDATGRLNRVTRSGANLPSLGDTAQDEMWSYEYEPAPAPDDPDAFRLARVTDPENHVVRYAYISKPYSSDQGNVEGRLEFVNRVIEEVGGGQPEAVTRFDYGERSAGAAVSTTVVKDARGMDTTYKMDANGSVTEIAEPLGRVTYAVWDPEIIRKTQETLPGGVVKDYLYDENGNVRQESTRSPGGELVATTVTQYNLTFNKPRVHIDAEQRRTEWDIDPDTGDIRSMTDGAGNVTRYEYDPATGQLDTETDARGVVTDYGYPTNDVLGMWTSRRSTLSSPVSSTVTQTRVIDSRGRVTAEADGLGGAVRREFDGRDRVVRERRFAIVTANTTAQTLPPESDADQVAITQYTRDGQPWIVRNALGGSTTYTYDGLHRVSATSTVVLNGPNAGTIATSSRYDGNGNLTESTDGRGVVRRMTYDDLERLTEVAILSGPETPVGRISSYSYLGATDFKETETDITGALTTFVPDGFFRVKERYAPVAGHIERFEYDLTGNQTLHIDANGRRTVTAYDGLSRVTRVTRNEGGSVTQTVETKYEESPTSHMLKTEEYDSLRKLRVRYAHDVAGRVIARATLLEGAGSAEAVALTAGSPGDAGRNGEAAAWFAGGLPSAPVRYLEKVVYTPGAGLNGAPASMEEAIHEASATRTGQPRVVRIGRDGLGRETYRSRGGLRAAITTHDGVGARLFVVDENGNPTIWRNDSLGRPYEMEDAAQKVANYRWDAAGNKISEQDRRGVTRVFTYDNLGRTKRTEIAPVFTDQPWSETIDYLDASRQVRTTDARGSVTLTANDGLGRPATITQVATQADGGDRTRTIGYTGNDKTSETDWMGRATVFGYDGLQRLRTTTDPVPYDAQVVETFYDDATNRTRVRDRKGNVTVTQFDSLGRVVWVRRGACDVVGTPSTTCETVERNEYDASSNKVLSVDGVGNKTRFEYDIANRLVAREEGYEAEEALETTLVRFVLDPGGRVTEEHRGRLAATKPAVEYRYDALNRVLGEKNGLGEETIYGYDDEGNRTSVAPPAQPATTYRYDELGKLISVTQPATTDHPAAETKFGYDANRNKVRQEDARGNAVAYEYDRANRLTRMVQPLNLETSYVYDPNGGATSVTDPNGQTRTSEFDELGRLRTTTHAENSNAPNLAWRGVRSERFEYDANSNPTEIHRMVASGTDPPVGQAIVRVFDALDRLETETTSLPDGGEKTVRYEYFGNGTRRALIDANARRTEYGYDAQNRVKSMTTVTDGRTTNYTYYKDDLLHQVINPNGDVSTSTYDDAGRIDTLVTANAATTISSYDYGYDTNGNRTSQIETLRKPDGSSTTETTGYAYDAANRLKRVTYSADATYPQGRVATYTYDKAGNRQGERETTISTVPPTTEFPNPEGSVIIERIGAFDANNRLSSLSSSGVSSTIGEDTRLASYAFTYDNNGNEVQRTSTTQHTPDPQGEPRPATVVTTNSIYDLSDRLVEQERGGAIIARHEYDGEGRRTKKIGEEGIRQYVYDDTSILAEYDTNGLEIAKYDYGADRLIRLTRTDEGTRYFSFDGLGSVTSLTTLSGTVAASYRLDAWGNYRFTSELAPSKNRFGYTGHYWDKEASLYYAKARYYDPFTARFTQSDSFLGNIDDPPSLHRYFYAHANPTMFVDPTGHAGSDAQARHAGTYRGAPLPPTIDCSRGCISAVEGSPLRGAIFYSLNSLISPLGLADEKATIHPFAEPNQMGADYRAFEKKYDREVTVAEGGLALRDPSKAFKLLGVIAAVGGHLQRVDGETGRQYRGGPHEETRLPVGDGLESHHTPAKAASPLDPKKGPAIKMEPSDHHRTSSHGASTAAAEYRAQVKALIDQGKWREAMVMEIRDVRRVAGVKYNAAVQQMLAYARTLKETAFLQKRK